MATRTGLVAPQFWLLVKRAATTVLIVSHVALPAHHVCLCMYHAVQSKEGEGRGGLKARYYVKIVCDTFCVCPMYYVEKEGGNWIEMSHHTAVGLTTTLSLFPLLCVCVTMVLSYLVLHSARSPHCLGKKGQQEDE